jgi:hypothetical protein
MHLSLRSQLALALILVAGCQAAADANPLIGTWTSSDKGCASKYVFAEKSMYFEDPALPGLVPPSKGTARVGYGGSPDNPQKVVVQNLSTGVADDWILSDAKHAISGATAQCHYVKQ